MSDRRLLLLPVLFASQALFVNWAASSEHLPEPPALTSLSDRLGSWQKLQDVPVAADVAATLHADRLLDRIYQDSAAGAWTADLFVAWFESQRGGASQPHSPQVCLPANGWIPESTGPVTLSTSAGSITVQRYVVANQGARAVVLYWFQTPRRVLHNEWAAKFLLVPDTIRDHRTDTSLIRLVVFAGGRSVEETTKEAVEFAQEAYPALRLNLASS